MLSNLLFYWAETAEGRESGSPLSEEEELALLTKQAKQRRDSISQFKQNNREDLAETEAEELAVIEKYLPQQLSEEELAQELKTIISEVGASTMKDMGKVMGIAAKKFAGRADGKLISKIVREHLA